MSDFLEVSFAILVFALMFSPFYFLFRWLYRMKKQREKNDEIAVENFLALQGGIQTTNQEAKELVLATEILKHRFTTNDAGESYREYFPVFLQIESHPVFMGLHYYREVQKGGGTNGQFSDLLYRHAFWVAPMHLPDFVLKNTRWGRGKAKELSFETESQRTLFEALWKWMQREKIKAVEVKQGKVIFVRTLPMNWAIMGEKPIPTKELQRQTQGLLAVVNRNENQAI